MSRTDKDAPYWLTARWRPHHRLCPHAAFGRGLRDCDLPERPPKGGPVTRGSIRVRACVWVPVFEPRWMGGPPAWFRRLEFTGPDRAAVRDACRKAVTEYRATRDVDVIPPTVQHRHQAHWEWW